MSESVAPMTAATAAVCLWVAGIALWAAALTPQFFPIWRGQGDPLEIVAQHTTLWRVSVTLFLASAVATLLGCVLVFAPGRGPFWLSGVILLGVATPLWVLNLAARLSIVPSVARDRTPETETLLALVQSLTAVAWYVVAFLIAAAFAGFGADTLTTGSLPAWAGWFCLGSTALSVTVLIAARDAVPVIIYLPVVPLAIAASIAAVRGNQ
ncbi:hypothetical protein [Leucobacter ruminantium]|uniref:Uncharacterized protein n=1 Tax=Leucobacter ruminantium TaxID=1289170 RepID=A0A939S068_9MICO|nr:hypothetical protein [Leucobacter ruminantium]MBO1806571.1 hypothetical protein [Leucobacter ruminantium]